MVNCEPLDLSSSNLKSDSKTSHLYGSARYDGHLLPGTFADELENLKNMEVYDDDIWVCSFPKSGTLGTTWVQEMVWSILNGYEDTKTHLGVRFPFIDFNFLVPKKVWNEEFESVLSWENLARRPRPRFIKTHLPFDLLPRRLQQEDCKAKIVYVTRNPRDACISYYYQQRSYVGYDGTLEQYVELFIKDLVIYGPFWKNILSFWNQRHRSNVLILRYEDMKKNLSEVIARASEFLDKPLPATQISQLCNHLHFDQMKKNPLVNSLWIPGKPSGETTITEDIDKKQRVSHQHLRAGKVNQWKEEISDELKEEFEKWEMKHLEITDYSLDYDDLLKF